MPGFLDETIREDRLNAFLDHIEGCPDCREELSIRILISEGLPSLEKEASFNLNDVFDSKVKSGRKKAETVERLWRMIWLGLAFCASEVAVLIYLVISLGV
ncbi:MAG: hypothetical protein K6E33_00875 [Lachnospiraceae bacterium]|nr:hypothetical protein [Lachnospiraceae bacterium]